jgi:GT2 family glycosyltransferase
MLFSSGEVISFQSAGLRPAQTEGIWSNPAEVLTTRFLFFNQVAVVRREALDQSGFFREDLRIMEDYDLALRLSIAGPWAFIADPPVVWHEDAGIGLSRNVGHLDLCRRELRILDDLSNSAQFGPFMPRALLQRHCRLLRQEIDALVLLSQPGRIRWLCGRLLLLYLKIRGAIYRRLPFNTRMITRAISVQPESSYP